MPNVSVGFSVFLDRYSFYMNTLQILGKNMEFNVAVFISDSKDKFICFKKFLIGTFFPS